MPSYWPTISRSGRFVAFYSEATNLVPDDRDSASDIFLRDLRRNETILVSRATGPAGAKGNSSSSYPAISANGRFVAFSSTATNLVPEATSESQVFVRDLEAETTTLVSRASGADGEVGNGAGPVSISNDGRYVAFSSGATNLGPGLSQTSSIYVRDLAATTTTLVSRASGESGAPANNDSGSPAISADGSRVAFNSIAFNLDPAHTSNNGAVYIRDLTANTTDLVSRADGRNGKDANRDSGGAAISSDGTLVAFGSSANNLTPKRPDGDRVFVRDTDADRTRLASQDFGPPAGLFYESFPAISGSGRYVSFTRWRFDSTGGGVPGEGLYVRDLKRRKTTHVRATPGSGTPESLRSSLSGDGSHVAFQSSAGSLVGGGAPNGTARIFVSRLKP